jgi:hypothetical protein
MNEITRLIARRLETSSPARVIAGFLNQINSAPPGRGPYLLSVARVLSEELEMALSRNGAALSTAGTDDEGMRLLDRRIAMRDIRTDLRRAVDALAVNLATDLASETRRALARRGRRA